MYLGGKAVCFIFIRQLKPYLYIYIINATGLQQLMVQLPMILDRKHFVRKMLIHSYICRVDSFAELTTDDF